jgi:glucose-1-phosphate thymidylyltransferase
VSSLPPGPAQLSQPDQNKQLLAYDKPMIYYPLSVLMLAGIRDIMIVTTAGRSQFSGFGDSRTGHPASYAVQPKPEGIPQAFLLQESSSPKTMYA